MKTLGSQANQAGIFWVVAPPSPYIRWLPILTGRSFFDIPLSLGSRPIQMNLSHETADYENYKADDKNNQGGV